MMFEREGIVPKKKVDAEMAKENKQRKHRGEDEHEGMNDACAALGCFCIRSFGYARAGFITLTSMR